TFGNIEYAHSWVTGCFIAAGRPPQFLLPRMVSVFDQGAPPDGEVTIVDELDDGEALFARLAASYGAVRRLAIGARAWSVTTMKLLEAFPGCEVLSADRLVNPLRRVKDDEELATMARACQIVDEVMTLVTPEVVAGVTALELARDVDYEMRALGSLTASFDTGVWGMGGSVNRDLSVRLSSGALTPGLGISFDFGAVVGGYCSDFGRTVHIGATTKEYERVYDVVMAAQAAGIAAVRPGVTASSVDRATRQVIVDAGLGEWFKHRTGHCIGLDVHEKPFISEEDETPLEEGMTFTIEPSVFRPGHYGVRVEDIVVCDADGGRKLNEHPVVMVVNE
ncbi:MAG TPA: M24 family metallopeptidase, partial [Acidimicrobiales bacterium]|nr:M24 family metallopeptidase [Acidimicrobiales bacterium]